ncbi:hypothetical protein, partial [Modestobacter marinus]|uniref:hypothetical protein n=1 Tax=Modestobacter marinus TaxID=477641 RepID=UPI00201B3052
MQFDPQTMSATAPPPQDAAPRGGALGFLGTVPGILTALAGVITAMATFYTVHVTSGSSGSTLDQPADPPPEVTAPVDPGVLVGGLDSAPVPDTTLDAQVTGLVTDCTNGAIDACTGLLDLLAWTCSDGDPSGCDLLYWVSPVGSDYEAYGATCGVRAGWELPLIHT